MLFDPKKDFNNLKYKVFSVESNILENVKELRPYAVLLSHEGNTKRADIDKLVRFTMVFYDKKSPLIRSISNIGQRKNEAALVSGYDLKMDADVLEELFDFTDKDLQLLALQFLVDQNDMYWSMLQSNWQTFWEYQRALNTRIESFNGDKQKMDALNVKSKLMDECDKITERVETYLQKVFGDGEEQVKAKELKSFTPETMAYRKKNV